MGQGKRVRSLPPEEEGAAEPTCDGLTTTSIPRSLALLGGGGREKSGVKLSLGWGESILRFSFISQYPPLICLVIN